MDDDIDSEEYKKNKKKVEEQVDEEIEEEPEFDENGIFLCEKCGFVLDGSTKTKREELLKKYKAKLKVDMFKNIKICPICGSNVKKINKKQMEKAKLKLRLKKLAEEEKIENEIASKQIELSCNEIIDETMKMLTIAEFGLEMGKNTATNIADQLYNNSFSILDAVLKQLRYSTKDLRQNVTLSPHFILGFREAILDYNKYIIQEYGDLAPENIISSDVKAFKLGEQEYLINKSEKKKLKEFKKDEKLAKEKLGNDFTKILKNEVK